jgi:hypothetical protein
VTRNKPAAEIIMPKKIIDDEFIRAIEALALHTKASMQGFFGGNHRTRAYGQTVEFSDFREYALGDDIRRIDWNLYSRFEKHFVRLFVDERQMHIQIFLDCSASMSDEDGGKAAYALRLAAALGFLSVQSMDKVSYKLIRGGFAEDLCGTIVGKDAYFRGMGKLEEVKFGGTADIGQAVTTCENPGFNDGLTVIISDFMTESDWKKAVDYLVYRHRQVMLIQALSPEDAEPRYGGRIRLVDAEAAKDPLDLRHMKMKVTKSDLNVYRTALADYRAEMRAFCASRDATCFFARSDEKVEKLLFGTLAERGVVT